MYLPEHRVSVKEPWSEDDSQMATVDHDRQGQAGHRRYHQITNGQA